MGLTLAACDPASTPDGDAPASLVRSPNAGPGNAPVPAARAVAYFNGMCAAAKLGRASLDATAAQNGFVQNSNTTTYYHQREDLSVKLADGSCSIVFTSKDNPATVQSALTGASADLGPVRFRDAGVVNGRHYYNARIRVS
ncbi:MAG: hypothetical protein ACWA5A_18610 [Marinibacterium sp.]